MVCPPVRCMETQIDRQRRLAAMADMAERITQDLKNPLGSLALYASILRRELQGDDDMTRITGFMISAIQSMDHFLDSYATFSSVPSPRLGPVNVSAWLDDTAKQLEMMNMGKGIRVETRYDHVLPEIDADRDLLSRLSLNLVLNAVQGMPQGGDLTIATCTVYPFEPGREFLEVRFIDTGEGIAEENRERIFDPFFTTRKKGNGLGLAIVHRIVEAHHGYIEVESVLDHGATFIVLLPYDLVLPARS